MTTTSSGRLFAPYTPPAGLPSIRPAPRPRRVYPPWLAPLLVGATVLAVAVATMSPWPVGVFYDDGIYLILGKALATGEGYRYLNLPGHPAATHYPPGYPALLAILWLVGPAFPGNVALFKLANALLLSLAATGFYVFSRRELGLAPGLAAGAILLGCLTIPVLAVTGVLFSEPLFLAILAVGLPACERALRDEDTRGVVIAALVAGGATLVRSLGLPLVGALVVGLLLRRRYHAAAIAAAVAAAMIVPWHVWTAVHADGVPRVIAGSYGSYTGALAEALDVNGIGFLGRIAAYNLSDLARPIGAVFAPGIGGATRALIVLAVVGVMSVGASVLIRRAPATALFLLGYATIVVAWPYAVDRFLWGVWPLLVMTLALGAAVGFRGARERGAAGLRLVGHATLAVAAGALVLGLVRYNVHGYRQRWWDSAQRAVARQLLPLVEWTERHTHRDDVVASEGDPLLHLYTGRHSVPTARWAIEAYPATADSATRVADLQELISVYNPRYLLVTSNKATTGPGAAALRNAPRLGLHILTILPGGGAVFATTPDVKRR